MNVSYLYKNCIPRNQECSSQKRPVEEFVHTEFGRLEMMQFLGERFRKLDMTIWIKSLVLTNNRSCISVEKTHNKHNFGILTSCTLKWHWAHTKYKQ